MGILSFLGLGDGKLTDKQIEKTAKLASNPFAQPDVRREQMEKLLRDGSEAAIAGVLNRFSVNSSQAIADEEEKRWLKDELTGLGAVVIPPIKRYLRKETNLSFAAQALLGVLPGEAGTSELLSLLEVYTPDDYRADEQKRQLMLILGEIEDARVLPALVPYLRDHSDDVRHHVIELFAAKAQAKDPAASSEAVRTAFAELLANPDTSPRIAQQAAAVAADLEWTLPGLSALTPVLEGEFFADKKGIVRRRVKRP